MSRLEELRKKVRKIVQEKKILELELQSKKQECQQLSEMKQKDASLSEKDALISSLLQEKISWKQKEIESLEKELKKKESDLQSAQQEAKRQENELLKTQAELKEKQVEVKQLKRVNENLSCSYNTEKKHISELVQLTVDLTSQKREMEVCPILYLKFCIFTNPFYSPLATTG